MKKKRSQLSTLILTLLAGSLCLAVLGLGWMLMQLPELAQREFGPPALTLGTTDRILYSARLFLAQDALEAPPTPPEEPFTFVIDAGESASSIATRLEDAGLIRSDRAFLLYLIYSGQDTSIQAGKYALQPGLDARQTAAALQDATPQEVSFQILPGWRLEEIAEALPTSGLSITPAEFLRIAYDPASLIQTTEIYALDSLEGRMFPGGYTFPRDTAPKEFFTQILGSFEEQLTPELKRGFEQQGLSLQEAVILASIVQREAVVAEERPMIASVFLNRLAVGMKLESDPTTQYAIGFDPAGKTWWKNPLYLDDLTFNSPYNTYSQNGLPPGPICSPGLSALRAVAFPAETPYYFFRAACDGSGEHTFSVTFEEHLEKSCP